MEFLEYFQSYENYFWEWENQILATDSVYETLTIPQGSTIAYERFVMETLELLSLDGFPPFGSLLLTLIATNATGKESLVRVFEIVDQSKTVKKEKEYPKGFTYAHKFLKTLADLPPEFKEGDKRKQLLQTIFKNCHNRLADFRAKGIMQHYKDHKHTLITCANKIPFSEANLKKDIQTLAHLNIKYPTQQSLLNAISGIMEIPLLTDEVVEQQPVAASKGDFVDELIKDPKTFPVGSLIHRIWGGLNIPLHHSAPSHQPLGGISDLTNKGDFDKLLISEFANDDEVFMSRIANNEALYIKREVPPESDKFVRLLLIDCSLKNWGTPKILAFASALAIAKHPKTDIECRIFVLGNGYQEVSAETVTDVIEGLNNLGSKLDAAPALQEILDENTDVKHSEVFLITSEDAIASADMQRTLNDNQDKVKYIITAETEGNLNFYRMQNRGRKLIQHIHLPLEELWAKRPSEVSKKSKGTYLRGDTIPDFAYPILLPAPQKRLAVFSLNKDAFYLLTTTGALFKIVVEMPRAEQFFRAYNGGELLLHNLSVKPNGKYALYKNEDGEYILAAFYPKEMYVSILNLTTREYHKKKISLKGNSNDYSIVYDNGFYLFTETGTPGGWFRLEVYNDELSINHSRQSDTLEKYSKEVKERIKRFEAGFIAGNVLLNFMPLSITDRHEFQFNKQKLTIEKGYMGHSHLNLRGNKNFVPIRESVYEKMNNRFIFSDGSAIYRDAMGVLTFKSSDTEMPELYMITILNGELAVATDAYFAGNKNYFKGEPGQKIISIEEFENKFFKPFINIIMKFGT